MPSIDRRTLLAALGTTVAGGLAGCSSLTEQSPPAGSLRFENDHQVPHQIRIEVTGVGSEPGRGAGGVRGDVIVPPQQRNLTASATVEPGTVSTYPDVFSRSVWYGVQFALDGEIPEDNAGTTRFNPGASDGGTWEFLTGKVYESGEFSWQVQTTDNPGQFSQ